MKESREKIIGDVLNDFEQEVYTSRDPVGDYDTHYAIIDDCFDDFVKELIKRLKVNDSKNKK